MLFKKFLFVFSILSVALGDNRLRFNFYHDNTFTTFLHGNLENVRTHPSFVNSRQTVMFHNGEGQSINTLEVRDLVNAYAANGNFNFIHVTYDDITTISTGSATALAGGITGSLIRLFDNGYSSGLMNLIGFGLGAQIMARASRQVQSQSSRRHIIGRLTGLDPWNLGPINSITIGTLSSADAQLVESIHTESSLRGDHESRGHVSFFPNGGVNQPWCSQTLPGNRADCSHIFALVAWTETVRAGRGIFPSLQCESWSQYVGNYCNSNSVANMGRVTATNLRGTYFLRTNNRSPFNRDTPFP